MSDDLSDLDLLEEISREASAAHRTRTQASTRASAGEALARIRSIYTDEKHWKFTGVVAIMHGDIVQGCYKCFIHLVDGTARRLVRTEANVIPDWREDFTDQSSTSLGV